MTDQATTYYHGTRADLREGDLIGPGRRSNFGSRKPSSYVYLSATLDAAIWGAELAAGEGPQRIYIVAPTGPIEDDPNLTDKRFPGNPTRSYRSRHPFRVVGEVMQWTAHPPERLAQMRAFLASLPEADADPIED
ncbi:NAD(+)--rifampin ADP-ribosyltransferase [Luteimonas viscosa]|nr:NAD(+)--rifampin ADP-ribosyltransferase [Luteimonas viscosa]